MRGAKDDTDNASLGSWAVARHQESKRNRDQYHRQDLRETILPAFEMHRYYRRPLRSFTASAAKPTLPRAKATFRADPSYITQPGRRRAQMRPPVLQHFQLWELDELRRLNTSMGDWRAQPSHEWTKPSPAYIGGQGSRTDGLIKPPGGGRCLCDSTKTMRKRPSRPTGSSRDPTREWAARRLSR